jgi:hypothetical protein
MARTKKCRIEEVPRDALQRNPPGSWQSSKGELESRLRNVHPTMVL